MVFHQKEHQKSHGKMICLILKILAKKTLLQFVVRVYLNLRMMKDTRRIKKREMRGNGDSAEKKNLFCNSFACIELFRL